MKFELSKEGDYKAQEYTKDADFEAWEALVRLYKWKRLK
jgi:hypothetical protein